MKNKVKIFAIVVTYNGKKWYDKCFGSLEASEIPVNIVAIDNASTDGSTEYIAEHFPDAHLIKSDMNLGFAKANNIGIRYAIDNGADYVFLLNQDAWISNNSISLLVKSFSSDSNIGIVSPIHLNGSGTAIDWKFATNMPSEFISDAFFGKLRINYPVPYINAAAWLISKHCLNMVGGFDTSLFVHYGEDINYCHRLKYFKFLLLVNTSSVIYHDREFRKGNDNEYKNKIFKRNPRIHSLKLNYGNINYDFNYKKLKNSCILSKYKSLFHLNFTKVKFYNEELKLLKLINNSRINNLSGNSPWLF